VAEAVEGERYLDGTEAPGETFTLELTGPGPEAGCREVVDSMRKDARVVSVEVLLDAASRALPVSTAPPIGSAQAVSTVQPMGTMRSEPDGDWAPEPRNGVPYAQVARDRYECDLWAVDQTGFDPTKDDGGLPPSGVTPRAVRRVYALGIRFPVTKRLVNGVPVPRTPPAA
jgi:hypothetical protein